MHMLHPSRSKPRETLSFCTADPMMCICAYDWPYWAYDWAYLLQCIGPSSNLRSWRSTNLPNCRTNSLKCTRHLQFIRPYISK